MKLKKILLPIFVWVAILSASLIAVVAGIAIKENRVKGAQRVNSNIESTETPGASNEYFDVSIQDGLYVKIKDYDPEWYSYKMLVEVDGVIVTDNGTNGGYELLNSQTPGFYYNELALQNHNVNVQNVKVHLVRFTGGGASIEVWDGELSATLSKTVLTFDANGGSFSNGSALIKKYYWPGQTIDDKPNAPTHSTRTFSFWNPSIPETAPSSDATYSAWWQTVEIWATYSKSQYIKEWSWKYFSGDGWTMYDTPVMVGVFYVGDYLTLPNDPLEGGLYPRYVIEGWYSDYSFTNRVTNSTIITSDLTGIYVNIVPVIEFNVDVDGIDMIMPNQGGEDYYFGLSVIVDGEQVRLYGGILYEEDEEALYGNNWIPEEISAEDWVNKDCQIDLNFYVYYQKQDYYGRVEDVYVFGSQVSKSALTFDANGGSFSDGSTSTVKYYWQNQDISQEEPVRSGYTFAGWSPTLPSVATSGMATSYTAQWTENSDPGPGPTDPETITLTFNFNGGSAGTASSSITVEVGDTITQGTPVRSGYTFTGWSPTLPSVATSGMETSYTAQWRSIVTIDVNVDHDGVDISFSPQGVYECKFTFWSAFTGDSFETKYVDCENLTNYRPGGFYTSTVYDGWIEIVISNAYENSDLPGTYQPGGELYHDQTYSTISLEFDSGVNTRYYWPGTTINETAEREGYTFAGWYDAEEGGNPMPSIATNGMATNWYAHWTKIVDPANIRFYNESGEDLSSETLTLAYGSTIIIYVKATYGDSATVISPSLINMGNSSTSGEVDCITTVESANNRLKAVITINAIPEDSQTITFSVNATDDYGYAYSIIIIEGTKRPSSSGNISPGPSVVKPYDNILIIDLTDVYPDLEDELIGDDTIEDLYLTYTIKNSQDETVGVAVGETEFNQLVAQLKPGRYMVYPVVGSESNYDITLEPFEIIISASDVAIVITANDLTYNGQEQTLINASVLTKSGNVYYSTTTSLNAANYLTSGSTTTPKGTNAGVYNIYYYLPAAEDETYNEVAGMIAVEIKKADNSFTMETPDLYITGANQTLVTITPTDGTVYYRVGGINEIYDSSLSLTASNYNSAGSTTKPSGKDAGTYIVYYYIKSSNYNDIAGWTQITIKSNVFENPSLEISWYDTLNGETGKAGSDGKLNFTETAYVTPYNMVGATFQYQWYYIESEIDEGAIISDASVLGGTAIDGATLARWNVSGDISAKYIYAVATVKRTGYQQIIIHSKTIGPVNGMEYAITAKHSCDAHKDEISIPSTNVLKYQTTKAPATWTATVDSHATALNNYALLSVTLKVLDEEASIVGEGTSIILDATENETLTATLKNGELEILGLDSAVLLAGWKVEVTLKCVSSAGYAEKSMSFTIEITELTQMKLIWEISPETTLYYGETATITLKLTDESDAEFTDYDKEITCDTSNVTDYLKISGSGLTWTVTAINVPNGNFTFTFNIPAYNEEYADATLEIIIEKDAKHSISDKTLGISRREITITSDGASKDYDGTPLTCNTYKIELTPDSESEKDLSSALAVIDGVADTESVTITGSRTETGSSDNTISEYLIKQGATDVTHCYNITVEEGTLVINKNKDVLEIVEASGLVCTGEVQDLIVSAVHINPETTDIKGNALTTSTVYYAFEELNANNYTTAGSKTIPTGLHAGTYNVYIYVPESANYNAVGAMVAVKIEQSTTLPEVTNVKLSDVGVVSWDVPSLTTLGQLSIAYTYNLQLFNDEDVQVGETAINISVTSYDVSALMVNKVDTYYAKVQAISSIEGCDIYGVKCVGNSDWSEASNTVTSFSVVFNVGNEKIGGESVGFVGIRNDDNSKTTSLTQNVLPGWLHNALDAQKKNQTNPFKYYYPTEANALFSIYAIANTINGYSTSFDYWLADNATKPTVVTAYFEATPNELILIMDGNASDVVISENENWTVSGTQASKAVNYAAPYGVLPDNTQITRTGYIFGGWFAESSCTTQVDSTTIMNSVVSVTIYAKWTPITYKVKYDGNGGTTSDGKSNISDSRTWTYDVEQTLWPNYFVKSGAKFLGWDKDATVTTATYKANDSVNNLTTTQGEEVVLYAIWASNTYTANIYIQKTAGDQYDTKSSVAISSSVGKVIYGTQDENSTVGNIVDEAIKTGAIVENGIKFAYAKYNGSTIGTATATAVTSGVTFVANSFYSKVGDDYFVLSNQPTDWGTATYYKLQVETGKSIVVVGESTVIDFYFDRVEHTLTLNPNETTIIEVDTTVTAFEANKYYRLNASGEYEKITTVKPSDWGTQDGQGNNVKYYIVITPVFGNTGWTSAEDNAISKNYRYEQIYGVLPQPTKAGYELAGWSTNKDATSADASITANTKMGTSDITLYAVWEPVKYEVSFSAQYNKVDTQILTYEANKYYSFNSSNGAFVLLTSTTAPADWGTATYYIYDSTITNPDSQEVDYGVAYGSMPSVTREGYRFASWNTKPDGSGSTITETTLVSISGDHTVYAMWTAEEYTITFDKNGATGIISSYIVTFGRPYYEAIESSSNEEGLPIIDRAGYEFIGWLIVVNNVETDDYVDIAGTVIVEYAQDHKLKFLWQAKGDILVTADANGGTIPTTAGWTGTGNSADKTVTFGEAYGLLPVPTREGYTFSKWTTIDASSNAKIDVTAETLVSNAENHEITAEWTPNQYTVKYDGNGATSGSTENSSHVYDTPSALTANGFIRAGYNFAYWTIDKEGSGDKYNDEQEINIVTEPNATITLYAQWTARTDIIVTADANGGTIPATTGWSGTGNTVTKAVTFKATYGTLPTPTREGYTFKGWWETATSDGSAEEEIKSSTIVEIAESHTIYARWQINDYILTADANGGKFNTEGYTSNNDGTITVMYNWTVAADLLTATKSVTYNSSYGVLLQPEREGYNFEGWFTAKTGGSQVSNTTIMIADNVIIYAQWSVLGFELKFEGNGTQENGECTDITFASGETCYVAVSRNYGETYGTLPTVTRVGHNFVEWNTQSDGKGTKVTGTEKMPADDVTVYAIWEIKTVKVVVRNLSGTSDEGTLTINNSEVINNNASNYYSSVEYKFGDTITLHQTHGEYNYSFIKWLRVNDINNFDVDAEGFGTRRYENGFETSNTTYTITNEDCDDADDMIYILACYQYRIEIIGVTNFVNGSGEGGTYEAYAGTSNVVYDGWYQPYNIDASINKGVMSATPNDGYKFMGWYVTAPINHQGLNNVKNQLTTINSSTNQVEHITANSYTYNMTKARQGSIDITVSSDCYLTQYYAVFLQETTLTIDPNGGSYEGSTAKVEKTGLYGETLTISDPIMANYTFTGWAYDSVSVKFDSTNKCFTYDETDAVLIAQYNINQQTLTITYSKDLSNATSYEEVILSTSTDGTTINPTELNENGVAKVTHNYDAQLEISINFDADSDYEIYIDIDNDGNKTNDIKLADRGGEGTYNWIPNKDESLTIYVVQYHYVSIWMDSSEKGIASYGFNVYKDYTDTATLVAENQLRYYVVNGYDVVLNATANPGYHNIKWKERGTDVEYDNPWAIDNVLRYMEFEPSSSPIPYTLVADARGVNEQYPEANIDISEGKLPSGWLVADDGKTAEIQILYTEKFNVLPSAILPGYSFAYWVYADGTSVSSSTTMPLNGATIYATYSANSYVVKYDSNKPAGASTSVSGTMENQTFVYDVSYTLPSNTYRLEGYTFLGWDTVANGTNKYKDGDSVSKLTTEAEITLYAQWRKNVYFVEFDSNTGIGSMNSIQCVFDTRYNLPANTYTKTGYTFNGWNTNAEGVGTSYSDGAEIVNLTSSDNTTITLYAQWKANPYTLTANANGGTIPTTAGWTGTGATATKQVTYDDIYGTLPTPTRTGYTFLNWNTEVGGTGDIITADKKVLTDANHTIYAQWSTDAYTVTLDYQGGTDNFLNNLSTAIDYTYENGQTGTYVAQYDNGTITISDNAFNGTKSLSYTVTEEDSDSNRWYYRNTLPVGKYKFSAYIQLSKAGNLYVRAQRSSNWDNLFSTNISVQANVWYYIESEFEFGASDGDMYLFFYGDVGTTYYIDDVMLVRTDTYTPTTTYPYNVETPETKLPYPAKAGYTFKEWNTKSDGTGNKVTSYIGTNLETVTYYAIYTETRASIEAYQDKTINFNEADAQLTTTITNNASVDKYQWQISTNGTSFTNIGGATSSKYTHKKDSQDIGTYYYRCIVTRNSVETVSNYVTVVVNKVTTTKAILYSSVTEYQYANEEMFNAFVESMIRPHEELNYTPDRAYTDTDTGITITYYYSKNNNNAGGTVWNNMTAKTLDVGTYYMYAEIKGSKNYTDIISDTIEFTVTAGDMIVSISSESGASETVENGIIVGFSKVYDGKKLPLRITADIDNYTLKYSTTKDVYDSTLDLTTNTLGEIGSITDVGERTYYYQLTATNYNTITGYVTLKITLEEVEVIWEGVTASYEYNGTDQGANIKAYINGYKADGTTERIDCIVAFSGKGTTFKDAGTYTANASLANSNYTLTNATYEGLVITPYAIKITAQDASMIYGNNAPTYAHTVTHDNKACTPFDAYTMNYAITNSSSADVTSTISSQPVGTYTINPSSNLSTNNYTITYIEATLTIEVCDLTTIVAQITPIDDQTYTGTAIEPTPEISVRLGSGRSEDLTIAKDFECTYSNNTEVGTAKITIKGKGNYTGTLTDAVSFEIVAKGIVKPTAITGTYIYNATEQEITIDKITGFNANTMKIVSGNKGTNAESYTLVVGLISNNFKWEDGTTSNVELPWSIAKTQVDLSVENSDITMYLGQTVTNTATLKYKGTSKACDTSTGAITATSDYATITATTLESGVSTITVVATKSVNSAQTITLSYAGDNNHESTTATFTLLIPTITINIVDEDNNDVSDKFTIGGVESGTNNEIAIGSNVSLVADKLGENVGLLSYKLPNENIVYNNTSIDRNYTIEQIQVIEDLVNSDKRVNVVVKLDKIVEIVVNIEDDDNALNQTTDKLDVNSLVGDIAVAHSYSDGKLRVFESSKIKLNTVANKIGDQYYAIKNIVVNGDLKQGPTVSSELENLEFTADVQNTITIEAAKVFDASERFIQDNDVKVATMSVVDKTNNNIVMIDTQSTTTETQDDDTMFIIENSIIDFEIVENNTSYGFVGIKIYDATAGKVVTKTKDQLNANDWTSGSGKHVWNNQPYTQALSEAQAVVLYKWFNPDTTSTSPITVSMPESGVGAELKNYDTGYVYTLSNTLFSGANSQPMFEGTWQVNVTQGQGVTVKVIVTYTSGATSEFGAGAKFDINSTVRTVAITIN